MRSKLKILVVITISAILILLIASILVVVDASREMQPIVTSLKNRTLADVAHSAGIGRARVGKEWIALHQVPDERIKQLVLVEDPTFFSHGGIDLTSPGQGFTTITQSLVKRVFFHDFKPGLIAKLRQSLIACFVVTPGLSKKQQLEIFINTAYFGRIDEEPIIGIGDAARSYFLKPFDQLTEDEFLSLIAMLPAPKELDPALHEDRNRERVIRIKRLLLGRCRPKGLLDVDLTGCATQ